MKYDIKEIEKKLFSNVIPKSMAGFDIAAFLSKYGGENKRQATVVRPKEIQAVFESRNIASNSGY